MKDKILNFLETSKKINENKNELEEIAPKYEDLKNRFVEIPEKEVNRDLLKSQLNQLENENTIIFYVAQKANKQEIKAAFNEAFGVKPEKVNTMNTILGRKKAFIKLPKTSEASEIANKIGLI